MDILDREFLLDNVGGDRDLLREILAVFFESSDEILGEVRAAVRKGDSGALHRTAHQLKGALANLGARAASEAARELEILGREQVLSGVEDSLDALDREIQRLLPELRSLAAAEAEPGA